MNFSDYEILIWVSDQHSGAVCSYAGDPIVRTPNLDALAADGTVFTNAYTSCPVCVPARASFMTGRYPLDIGMTGNTHSFPSHDPTFMHCLSMAGYQTTLCGRMHFKGLDQRHGFDQRIADDICPPYWGFVFDGTRLASDRGRASVHDIFSADQCASYLYDQYVADALLDYLDQPHEQKQAIVIGTYLPHWPLGAPEETVAYYRGKMEQTIHDPELYHTCDALKLIRHFSNGSSPESTLEERANYYAMIEEEDKLLGKVRIAWKNYLNRSGKKGIFIYVSDHGDHIGDKGFFGKQTLFELSAHIPLIIQVDGCEHRTVSDPVSLMDIGETLCAMTGAPRLPYGEGNDLSPAILNGISTPRPILSEIIGTAKGGSGHTMGTMVREGSYKLITYRGLEDQDLLFNIDEDPRERVNLVSQMPELYHHLKELAAAHAEGEDIKLRRALECVGPNGNANFLTQYGLKHPELVFETWVMP